MYQRYTSRTGGAQSEGGKVWKGLRAAVFVLLTAAVITLSVMGIPAIRYRETAQQTLIERMRAECGNAYSYTQSLSRTAGASSSSTLGQIRSRVYAADILNDLSFSLGGRYLVPESEFDNLYAIMDDYLNRLTTGMVTGDQQTALTGALESLVTAMAALD